MIDKVCFDCDIPVEHCTGDLKTCRKAYERKIAKQKEKETIKHPKEGIMPPAKREYAPGYEQHGRPRYFALKEAGLCVACGRTPSLKGSVYCKECREKEKLRKRKRYMRNVQNGVCTWCGKNAAASGIYCEACAEKMREYQRKRKLRSKKA